VHPDQKPPRERVPVPPPLPTAPKGAEPTSTVGLEIPKPPALGRFRIPGGRYARMGAALFGAGVLVGIAGAAVVLGGRAAPPVETAAPASTAVEHPKAALPSSSSSPVLAPAPKPQRTEPVTKPLAPVAAKAESALVQKAVEPSADPTQPPISSFAAPTCRQLLGKSMAERKDPKRATTQTVLANRALLRGNVKEAHSAYCLAWAWDRSNLDRRLNLATLYLVRRDWAKAAELGESALELDPESRRALVIVGDARAALNDSSSARDALLAAERKPSPSARELDLIVRRDLALAKRVERKRDFSLAERLYRRVLVLSPDHTGAMFGVASCLGRLGDRRAAEAWARRAKASARRSGS
jgi:tetratricopeptide (TPR) repeat protein